MKIKTLLFPLLWLVTLSLILAIYILRAKISGLHYGNTDFFKFYQALRFYFAGQNLYAPTIMEVKKNSTVLWVTANGNLNPPFLTLILLPLYYFNYATALLVWVISSSIFMLLGAWLTLQAFPEWRKYTLPILTAFALYIPNSANLAYGQISHYILALLTGAWLAARNHKDILAGIFIGFACAIKLFCGLFLLYFLCIKRFKLFYSTILTGMAAFFTSLMLFGFDSYLSYRSIFKKIVWYAASWNVSFYGFFTRLFSDTEKNHTLISIPHLAEILTLLCSISLLITLVYIWRKLGTLYFDIGYSLTLIAMLLFSPLGWIYYFGLLIVPYLVLIAQSRTTCYKNIIPPLACVMLFFSTLSGNFIPAPNIHTTVQILFSGGVGFYTLILFLILYFLVIKEKLHPTAATLPSSFISEKQWVMYYLFAFLPSLFSLFIIASHLR